jgi:tetratricopeptide (TPR) repeat protein
MSDTEAAIKSCADYLMRMGLFDSACKEYLELIDCIKKVHSCHQKSAEMTLITLETTLYCMLMTEFQPRSGVVKFRDVIKRLEKVIEEINETIEKLYRSKPMFLVRYTMLLNMIVLIRLENKDEPNKQHIKAILTASRQLDQKQSSDLLKVTSAIFFMLYTRCKHSHNLRAGISNECGFFHLVVQTSDNFFGLSRFDYAKAGYLIASKILSKRKHRSWGALQEAVYYKLGQLELGNPQMMKAEDLGVSNGFINYEKALGYFIEALNNHNKMKFSEKLTPIYCEKAIFQIVKIITEQQDDDMMKQLCTGIASKLRNIEFADFTITTEEELTHSLNKKDGLGTSSIQTNLLASNMSLSMMGSSNSIQPMRGAPKDVPAFEKALLVVQGIDKIVKILASKLRESELKPIQRKIEYNRMAVSAASLMNSLNKNMDSKAKRDICSYIRSVSIREPVHYKIQVKNNYFREVFDEISNIKLDFDFAETISQEKKPAEALDMKLIASERLDGYLTYKIMPIKLEHGEVGDLEITVNFLKCGYYRLQSLNWMLYEKIPFKHVVPKYDSPEGLKYAVIGVKNNAGVLQVNTENLSDKINFGEIQKSTLVLTNAGSTPIDEVYLASAEPLFTGFGIRSYGKIDPNERFEREFYVRGTLAKVAIIPMMFVYKTGGSWKYLTYFYEVAVRRPFSGVTSVEDLGSGRRLLTIDVIKNSTERQIEPAQIELVSLKMSSNVWKIKPETFRQVKNDSMMLISIQIEKRADIDPDTLYLTRNHAEVRPAHQIFHYEDNEMHLTKERLDIVDEFLKHQNLELQRVSQSVPCRYFVDFSVLLKSTSQNYYLCSFPSIMVRNIPVALQNRPEHPNLLPYRVKARFLNLQQNITHDFEAQPLLKLETTISVDCSGLQFVSIDHLFIRVLNSNEHRPKVNHTAVTVGRDTGGFQNNIYNWTGKTKVKISRVHQEEDGCAKKIQIAKDRDWRGIISQLKAVPNIKHFAILDPDTAAIWASSQGFEFIEYEDTNIKMKINERDCLLNLFKRHGNVDTKIAVRLINEKFSYPKEGGYNSSTHTVKFMNESKTMAGIAAKNSRCIFFGIFEKPDSKRLDDCDSEYLLMKIYNRIFDIAANYQQHIFHEDHRVTFTAVFTKTGCYELNNLLFTNPLGQVIGNLNHNEEVKLFIRSPPRQSQIDANLLA